MSPIPPPHTRLHEIEAALAAALEEGVVVDLETTGLDPATDRILEVAVLVVGQGAISTQFHSLVDPQRPIPADSTAIHGLRNQDVAQSPVFAEIAPQLAALLRGRTVIGHNVKFDISFLNAEFARLSQPEARTRGAYDFHSAGLCTASIARELIPRSAVGRYTLANVAEVCQVPSSPSHRALQDATTTFELAGRLKELAHRNGQR